MPVIQPLYQDAFNPITFTSPALVVTVEQRALLRRILDVCCSDTRFAEKAEVAIIALLTTEPSTLPVIESITPESAALGDPSFTLHVNGSGFEEGSAIIWNGSPEPTIVVSPTELTTQVDMSTAVVATTVPVMVQDANGALSNSVPFVINPLGGSLLSRSPKSTETKFTPSAQTPTKK